MQRDSNLSFKTAIANSVRLRLDKYQYGKTDIKTLSSLSADIRSDLTPVLTQFCKHKGIQIGSDCLTVYTDASLSMIIIATPVELHNEIERFDHENQSRSSCSGALQ